MAVFLVLLILFFTFLLIKAADQAIIALRRIAKQAKVGVFAISAIILALGTSLPELFVGITSALEEKSNFTLGVVMGSNIANITLIAGLSALMMGKIYIRGDYLRKDVLVSFLAGIVPAFLMLDGGLNRIDGLILLAIYGAYASSFFKDRFVDIGKEHQKETFFLRFIREVSYIGNHINREYGRLFLSIAVLLFSADRIVNYSTDLASLVKIPVFIVGLVLVAIGTSLPELVFSIRSLKDHQPSMFFGNILGSTIVNSTLIIGISVLFDPIEKVAIGSYLISSATFIVVFIAFWYFIKSKHRLDRWEAGLLVLLYTTFVVLEFVLR